MRVLLCGLGSLGNNHPLRKIQFRQFFSISLILTAVLLTLLVLTSGRAGDHVNEFDDYVEAGEFSIAMELAEASPSRRLRDCRLSAIARSQSQSNRLDSAIDTVERISDERIRTTTLDTIRSFGPDRGARGGRVEADFDDLIDLITSTIAPDTWDVVGGPGVVHEFEGGVFVDARGTLQRVRTADDHGRLMSIRQMAESFSANQAISTFTDLRCVSLPRLEKALQLTWAAGKQPSESMQFLAGLQKIRYLFVFPETEDIVLAGPAGAWNVNEYGCRVNATSGYPVLRLDDLVVLLRNAFGPGRGKFSCSIDPRRENLAGMRQFLTASARKPLRPGHTARRQWLEKLRDVLGNQEITIKGIKPETRVARVIVEADYHMKLIGMGIQESILGVGNYFDAISQTEAMDTEMLDAIRWWFTMDYERVCITRDCTGFELDGSGVKVSSENEILTSYGERQHTGRSKAPSSEFARRFNHHFETLAQKYPIYRELQSLFDMALFASVMQQEKLPQTVNWSMSHFLNGRRYQIRKGAIPTSVESVVNHRTLDDKHFVAAVSGGVHVDPTRFLASKRMVPNAELEYQRERSEPDGLAIDNWWWDPVR